ncbi:putative phosphonate ABC transporter permease [Rhizobium favelukesii]|uniref:Phosphonate ABC transporter permease n=1 Tax=Rhizobium favelukesii TaxID=348824 RepID=W6R4V6_9HYPH|nr:putative phosphonate ABC transporter permease [Rhizobium favelukesii]
MTVIDANRMHEIEQRYPEYFKRSFQQRFGGLMAVIATLVYALYATWFFDLPKLLADAHWERVGLYLSQWVSYDVQPEFRIGDDGIAVKYPRFSPLGDDPHPNWVINNPDGSVTVSVSGTGRTVAVSKTETTVTARGVSVPVEVSSGAPKVIGPVPSWMTVYDDNVLADLGFAGDVSISVDRVKVRKRFLGWANFVFDTQSPFFDKPVGEVLSLIVSGPELTRPIQPVARIRQCLEQQRLAAWRRLDQAVPDHRHGLPRHAARRPAGLSAGLLRRAQHHAEPRGQPGAEASL